MFDGKTVFLIANNKDVSVETREFVKNYDREKSVIVRFNGYKYDVNRLYDRCDMMVYRKNSKGYYGYSEKYDGNGVIRVFTERKDLVESNGLPNNGKDGYVLMTERYMHCDKEYTHTTGFQMLKTLLGNQLIEKIYLVGFTFHGKMVSTFHNEVYEYDWFVENCGEKVERLF